MALARTRDGSLAIDRNGAARLAFALLCTTTGIAAVALLDHVRLEREWPHDAVKLVKQSTGVAWRKRAMKQVSKSDSASVKRWLQLTERIAIWVAAPQRSLGGVAIRALRRRFVRRIASRS